MIWICRVFQDKLLREEIKRELLFQFPHKNFSKIVQGFTATCRTPAFQISELLQYMMVSPTAIQRLGTAIYQQCVVFFNWKLLLRFRGGLLRACEESCPPRALIRKQKFSGWCRAVQVEAVRFNGNVSSCLLVG